ncbi:hypothetical protein ACP26L_06765 [Paenibacillus sp. S-38]|uniref:hypothetical protein n=1 Tax=Paenibacillus sp. S-38 TaxID=3416710 RepID=UPI003CED227D
MSKNNALEFLYFIIAGLAGAQGRLQSPVEPDGRRPGPVSFHRSSSTSRPKRLSQK